MVQYGSVRNLVFAYLYFSKMNQFYHGKTKTFYC